MREYEGFGGNALFLDSKKVIAQTQYIREECAMDRICNASFYAPNFNKNGCITITTENNVIPIYFLQKHTPSMVEAFGIIEALVKKGNPDFTPRTGKMGEKLGMMKCVEAGHPILRVPGRMNIFLMAEGIRFEYALVDQGCAIPYSSIFQIVIMDEKDNYADSLYPMDADAIASVQTVVASERAGFWKPRSAQVIIAYSLEGSDACLAFEGKRGQAIGESLIEAFSRRHEFQSSSALQVAVGG